MHGRGLLDNEVDLRFDCFLIRPVELGAGTDLFAGEVAGSLVNLLNGVASRDHLENLLRIRGLSLGLIDGLGNLRETLRARYGEKVEVKMIAAKRPLFALPGLGLPTRASIGDELLAAAEDRTVWSRIGL